MGDSFLILEDGTVFKGEQFGYDGEAVGGLAFSTGMTGYMKTLTDSRYSGQLVFQTFPLIGNYGIIQSEMIGRKVHLSAYIVRQWCQEPSNFRSEGNLDTFLRDHKIPGLCGVDTRSLMNHIRKKGKMNAMISKTPVLSDKQWAELKTPVGFGEEKTDAAE